MIHRALIVLLTFLISTTIAQAGGWRAKDAYPLIGKDTNYLVFDTLWGLPTNRYILDGKERWVYQTSYTKPFTLEHGCSARFIVVAHTIQEVKVSGQKCR